MWSELVLIKFCFVVCCLQSHTMSYFRVLFFGDVVDGVQECFRSIQNKDSAKIPEVEMEAVLQGVM